MENLIFQFKNSDDIYKLISLSENLEILKFYTDFDKLFLKSLEHNLKYDNTKNRFSSSDLEAILTEMKKIDKYFIGLFFNAIAISFKRSEFYLDGLISKIKVEIRNNFTFKLQKYLQFIFDDAIIITISHSLITAALDLNIIKIDEKDKNGGELKTWKIENQKIKNHIILLISILNLKLPMIVKPLDWKKSTQEGCYYIGGYLLSQNLTNISINLTANISKNHYLLNLSDEYINAINYLQSSSFTINIDYLNQLLNLDIIEIEKEFTYSVTNQSGFKEEINVNFQRYVQGDSNIVESNICYEFLFNIFLLLAFKDYEIYFVYFMDFRSRIYPHGYPLNFYTNKILRKCFLSKNRDKYFFEDQLMDKLYLKYEENLDFYYKIAYNYTKIKSKFLIGMDASASAFQIQGTLMKDLKMMKLTNIFNPSDERQDIYSHIMTEFKVYLNNNPLNYNDFDFEFYEIKIISITKSSNFKNLVKIILDDRTFWKSIILPLSYNEGSESRTKKFYEYFVSKIGKNHRNIHKFSEMFEKTFIIFFDKTFPRYKILKKIFNYVSNKTDFMLLKNDYFHLKQFYPSMKVVKYFRRRAKGKPLLYTFSVFDFQKTNKQKQKTATFVNFIHSLDSAIMINVINRFRERGLNIFTVHDCFYVNIINLDFVREQYNLAFIDEIILKKPLEQFLKINNIDIEKDKILNKNLKMLNDFDNIESIGIKDINTIIKESKFSLKP